MSLWGTSNDYGKDTWLAGFNSQLENSKGTLLEWIGLRADDSVTVEGRRAYMKIELGDSLGQATISEGGDYPTPGDLTADEALLNLAHLTHAIKFSTEEVAFLDSGAAAAAPIMSKKLAKAREAMERDIERQAWMDGTGILANEASDSGSTVTLDATTTSQVDRDRYIWLDDANRMRYDLVHGTTGAQAVTGFTITDINETTNVITCSATMTAGDASHVIVRSGDWASGGAFRSLEFPGVQALVDDDNTYLGIDRTGAGLGAWKSIVVGNSGTLRDMTEVLGHTLINRMARRASGGAPPSGDQYGVFANFGSWTAYHQIMSPGLRYTINEKPDVAWPSIDFFGLPLYRNVHCPKNGYVALKKNSIHFVRPKHNGRGMLKGLFDFMTLNGSIFFLGNAASGAGHSSQVFAYLDGFLGMYSDRPRDHGWLRDINESGT